MKRIVLLLFAVLVLAGCSHSPVSGIGSSIDQNTEINSALLNSKLSQNESEKISKYQGKKKYNNISLGTVGMVHNEKNYYYSDEVGFYCVNKKSGERTVLSEELMLVMKNYQKTIYFVESANAEIIIFDTETHQKTLKSYKQLFSLNLQVPQIRYNSDAIMVENGWIVSVWDNLENTGGVYYTDRDFTSKKQLPIERFDFVLDDDVFYFDKDGNVLCYNLSSDKHSYVTKFADEISDKQSSNTLSYLGQGKILVCRNNKIHIIDLVDCSNFLEMPYNAGNLENRSTSAIYDDDKMYLLIWETETSYRIDVVSRDDKKVKTIFRNTLDLPLLYCELVGEDEQYLYVYNTGYDNDDGTSSSGFSQIKKNPD